MRFFFPLALSIKCVVYNLIIIISVIEWYYELGKLKITSNGKSENIQFATGEKGNQQQNLIYNWNL